MIYRTLYSPEYKNIFSKIISTIHILHYVGPYIDIFTINNLVKEKYTI